MKRLLFLLLFPVLAFAQGPTFNSFSRIDTLNGSWVPYYFGGVGGNYRYTAIATTQTADIRIAFTYRDTAATVYDKIFSLEIVNAGTGYLIGETLGVARPGEGAEADSAFVIVADTTGAGVISSLTLIARGNGYPVDTVALDGGSGSAATVEITATTDGSTRGLILPFITGQNPSWGVPQVHVNADTIWVKGANNDIIVHVKF